MPTASLPGGVDYGTFAFLFTDIEGSTRLWESEPEAMKAALALHDQILKEQIASHGGSVFSAGGDGFAAAFGTVAAAAASAAEAQRRLVAAAWTTQAPIRVRMGLHLGPAQVRDGNFFGSVLNRCARLMATAAGGQIVCSQAGADILSDDLDGAMKLLDLGEHRLRDLARPEHVYQLCAPGLPDRFPPLRSLDTYPTNLPPQLSEFIGRDAELAAVAEALEGSRIVTLSGVGGVGKTRLALQAAAEVVARYPGGVWLVELAGLVDPGGVVEAVTAALRVAPQSGMTLLEALAAALSGRPTLVVLDNCEHLVEEAADFAGAAIRAAPELAVLVTSREALGVTGERVLAVRPLPVPREDQPASEALRSEAVQLFCGRAQAVRSSFSLGPDNADAVVRICRRLDGIPLAVELAAARVRSMAPAEIASRLDARFQLLTGGARGAASRHQTLRRAIDWSFDLLSPQESQLIQRLSVCAGGWDLAAAQVMGTTEGTGPWMVVDLLDHLIDKSLVVPDDLGCETRYRMLETIRDYAFEKLEASGIALEVRARHAAYYTELSEEIGTGMRGPEELAWLERAERELDNLRAAVVWSCDHDGGDLAQRILAALGLHGTRIEASVSTWAAGVVSVVRVAMAAGAPADPRWPATLSLAAWRLLRDGDMEGARVLGEEARRASADTTDLDKWARCMVYATTTAADIYSARTDVAGCEEWARLAHEIGDPYVESMGSTMVCVHRMFSGLEGALEAGASGVASARSCGSPTALAYAMMSLGQAVGPTDPHRSVALLEDAIRAAESVANEWAVGVCSAARGAVLSGWGNRPAAARALLESAQRSHAGGNRTSVAQGLWGVAAHLALEGRPEGAAVILGWVGSLTVTNMVYGLGEEFSAAVSKVPERLGLEGYEALVRKGAGLEDEEVIAVAAAEVDALTASNESVD